MVTVYLDEKVEAPQAPGEALHILKAGQLPGCAQLAQLAPHFPLHRNLESNAVIKASNWNDPEQRLVDLWNSESPEISQALGMRVSHYQVFLMILEVMKLETESNYQNRESRKLDRESQLLEIAETVKGYKEMSKALLSSGLGGAGLAVLSVFISMSEPFIGKWTRDSLASVFSSFKGMKPAELFRQGSQMCSGLSQAQQTLAQAQNCFYQSKTTAAEHQANLHRTDEDNTTRDKEAKERSFSEWRDLYLQLLKTEADIAAQLMR